MSETLFDLERIPASPQKTENPCIALYGHAAIATQTCKGCIHLRYRPVRNPKARHWKCDLRTLTNGQGSDHNVTWPACARYVARTEAYHGG